MRAAALLACWTVASACSSHPSHDACTQARDHLIELRFAGAIADPDKLWQLLVDTGGDSNVDKRALKAALARPHDEPWFAALRDRQRFSPQMRRWVETCMAERSNDEVACIRAARTEPQLTACGR